MNSLLEKKLSDLSGDDEKIIVQNLIKQFLVEQQKKDRGGILAVTQKMLAYNSNKIEGSTLTPEQTANLFDTGTLYGNDEVYRAKDIEEMQGHFMMFSEMVKTYSEPLTEDLIKTYHRMLKQFVFEDKANGYPVGEYKNRYNIVSDIETAPPMDVSRRIQELIQRYEAYKKYDLHVLACFHAEYEKIHPFQDGNGRTGRILLFKECLRNGIIPFIIHDEHRAVYYRNLRKAQLEDDTEGLADFFQQEQQIYYHTIQKFLYVYEPQKSTQDSFKI